MNNTDCLYPKRENKYGLLTLIPDMCMLRIFKEKGRLIIRAFFDAAAELRTEPHQYYPVLPMAAMFN